MIFDPSVHPAQLASITFIHHISHILDSFPSTFISIERSPGHAGVTGNEEADRAAKVETIKPRANQTINKAWQRRVRGLAKTEGTKFLEVFPASRIPSAFSKSTPREIFGRTTQTLTGHGYTGEYYERMFLEKSPRCLCSRDNPGAPILMSRFHILQACPDINNTAASSPEPKHAPPASAKFLDQSGAFTKLGIPFHIDPILPPPRDPRPLMPIFSFALL